MKLETQLTRLNVDVAAWVLLVLLVKCERREMNRGRKGREKRKQNRKAWKILSLSPPRKVRRFVFTLRVSEDPLIRGLVWVGTTSVISHLLAKTQGWGHLSSVHGQNAPPGVLGAGPSLSESLEGDTHAPPGPGGSIWTQRR